MSQPMLRLYLWVLSFAACALGVFMLYLGARERATLEKAKQVLAIIVADISESGVYQSRFQSTYSFPHGLIVGLRLSEDAPVGIFDALEDLTDITEQFKAAASIITADGREIATGETIEGKTPSEIRDGLVPIFELPMVERGRYNLILEIEQGVDAPDYFRDEFVLYYDFSELELKASNMLYITGSIFILMAAAVMLILLYKLKSPETGYPQQQ